MKKIITYLIIALIGLTIFTTSAIIIKKTTKEYIINLEDNETVKSFISSLPQELEMSELINRINNLYIDDESKNIFKNIIEYMRKYKEGIEKNYIPFRILIESSGAEDKEISDILYQASLKYNYIKDDSKKIFSFYRYEKDYKFDNSFLIFQDLVGIKFLIFSSLFKSNPILTEY